MAYKEKEEDFRNRTKKYRQRFWENYNKLYCLNDTILDEKLLRAPIFKPDDEILI